MLPGVLDAWIQTTQLLSQRPGNPAALHGGGRGARKLLEDARERVATCLGAERAEVVFTSGATESDALAVMGGARGAHSRTGRRRVLVSGVEHDAVLEQSTIADAAGLACEVLPISAYGVTDLASLEDAQEWLDIALISVVYVASEIGTIQPVESLVKLRAEALQTLIHTDAAQAISTVDVRFGALGVDLMSIGGHKVGGPVGTGVLLAKRGTPLITDRPGGGHERGIRSGTPDVAGAVALATALEYTVEHREMAHHHAAALRDHLLHRLAQTCAGLVTVTVPPQYAVPTIIHLSLPTRHPEALLMSMDADGVHVSAGSACHAGVTRPSAVVMRMGRTADQALGVLRISTGKDTTIADIDAFVDALPRALNAGQALDRLEGQR